MAPRYNLLDFMTTSETAKAWGISSRRVVYLLHAGRVPGAIRKGKQWLIPQDAERPVDGRLRAQTSSLPDLSDELVKSIRASSRPMPPDSPDKILELVDDQWARLQYEAELAYLRGDFAPVMACFNKTSSNEAARLRASLVAVAAAISLGDYLAYREIEDFLKRHISEGQDDLVSACAELGLACAAVSANVLKMVPEWLKDGDFQVLPAEVRPFALYMRAKYLFLSGQIEGTLATAQTALALSSPEEGITYYVIYLHLTCAIACYHLGRKEEAKSRLLEVMRMSLPHGFITPFAEIVTHLGGLVEKCLLQEFPHCYDLVLGQWERTVRNWITFHNQFAKDNITMLLSLREYYIAAQLVHKVSYAQIAKQQNISVGRLKNIVQDIYQKLYISSREELKKYIY